MTKTAEPSRAHRRSVFERLAGWSGRHRWAALLLWVLALAGATTGASLAGSDFRNDFTLPGAESQKAQDLLTERAPTRAGGSLEVVIRDPGGLDRPTTRPAIEAMLTRLRALPHVADVVSPYPQGGAPPTAISADGTIGYATVALDGTSEEIPADATRAIIETARAAAADGRIVEVGGEAARTAEESEGGPAEGAGLLAALVVLVLLFGSLLAASLPIVIAVFAVGTAIGLVALASHVATVADFTTPLVVLVGLGVGIDYALLVLSRYRGELAAGADRQTAVRTALDTAGRTVFFAGTTVIIALLGLVLIGLGALQGVAVALAVTVLVTMLSALVLLPALLSMFGARMERTLTHRRARAARRPRGAEDGTRRVEDGTRGVEDGARGAESEPHAGVRALGVENDASGVEGRPVRAEGRTSGPESRVPGLAGRMPGSGGGVPHGEGRWWRRWSDAVARRPWPAALLPLIFLGMLCVPVLDMRLGFADAGTDSPTKTSTRAYELLAEGFGPGVNGPLVVVVDAGGRPAEAAAGAVRQALVTTPGIAFATPPIPAPGGDVATVVAFPASAPQDEVTARLVADLRSDILVPVARDNGVSVLVGGPTAAVVDVSDAFASRLPLFVTVVVGLSALLLLVLFRSVVIPVKAAVLNVLSVGAALGVMILVFQQGAFGVPAGPIEAFVPVMIFAIVFGLSMDYEVFLLARMHEEWERTRDAAYAVREGLATTGRVVTAAAAIMVVVFGSFLLFPDRMLQQFGLGLAVAVLIDAVIIRCLLLPAVMHLFGPRAWWLPPALARRLPRLALEHR